MPYKDREKAKQKMKEYRQKNKKKLSAMGKAWREKNKKHIAEYNEKNKEKIRKRKNAHMKEYTRKNKKEIKRKNTKYYKENRERISQQRKENRAVTLLKERAYNEKNAEAVKARRKAYSQRPEVQERRRELERKRFADPEYREKVNARRREANALKPKKPRKKMSLEEAKQKRRESVQKHREKNLEKLRKRDREYKKLHRERYTAYEMALRKRSPQRRIATAYRGRVSDAIRTQRGIKKGKTFDLLGISSWDFFIKHLTKKFKKGMTLKNYGKWHVDHIIPCASFDLTKESEQKKCFHYTNLQPLWAIENIRKGDRV